MIVIYLAGPITKPDPFENVCRAIRTGDILINLGYAVIIPHLSFFQEKHGEKRDDGNYGAGYELWMKTDFEFIRRADCVVRMSGYSLGADREVEYAISIGKPVFRSLKHLTSFYFEDALD